MLDDLVTIFEKDLASIHFSIITAKNFLEKAYNEEEIEDMRDSLLLVYRNIDYALNTIQGMEYVDLSETEE